MIDDNRLSAQVLTEIQARCDRATAGPWTSYIEGRDHVSGSSFIMTSGEDINPLWMSDEDQDFAAHARQDVPRLLGEVHRLASGAAADALDAATLAEIEGRCVRASRGPWRRYLKGYERSSPESVVTTRADGRYFELDGPTEDDHDFIAHARQEVPRLLAEVRRLRGGGDGGASPGSVR